MTPQEFRSALDRLSLTQAQAAERLGLSIRTINGYARGEWKIPRAIELALTQIEHASGGKNDRRNLLAG